MGAAAVKHGDDACLSRKSALHMKRLPGAVLFVFPNAIRVFSWMPQSGPIEFTGERAAHIAHEQTNRSSDSCIGAPSRTKHIAPAVYPELVTNRAVYNHQRSTTPRTYRSRRNIEHRIGNRFGGSQHHWHIFRFATRH